MEELSSYSPEEIILANLEELVERSAQIGEQERAHLRELAAEILSEYTDSASFLASLPEHRLPNFASEKGSPLPQSARLHRRVLLSMELRRLIPDPNTLRQEILFPVAEELSGYSYQRISYQKSPYADAAFQRFSELLEEPKATYAHSFHGACEDVYNGISEFCILPLESTSEGRLNSFSKLIEQYDIRIVATCDVCSGEDKLTRFALLRKSMTPLPHESGCPRYFEFSWECEANGEADSLLTAARLCGLRPDRAHLAPSREDPLRTRIHAVLPADEGDLLSFLLYLSMEASDFTSIGFYPHLTVARGQR
ncbi:MAG: hypothetical protein E7620_05210 [Ruminococcaceae bacterium]|nr:hypothetical protein [Oscillospiraceae bacterium]